MYLTNTNHYKHFDKLVTKNPLISGISFDTIFQAIRLKMTEKTEQ